MGMPEKLDDQLVIAISSRALFNLDDSHRVYQEEGLDAYSAYQIEREDESASRREGEIMVADLVVGLGGRVVLVTDYGMVA